jgi:hypothetical protein
MTSKSRSLLHDRMVSDLQVAWVQLLQAGSVQTLVTAGSFYRPTSCLQALQKRVSALQRCGQHSTCQAFHQAVCCGTVHCCSAVSFNLHSTAHAPDITRIMRASQPAGLQVITTMVQC